MNLFRDSYSDSQAQHKTVLFNEWLSQFKELNGRNPSDDEINQQLSGLGLRGDSDAAQKLRKQILEHESSADASHSNALAAKPYLAAQGGWAVDPIKAVAREFRQGIETERLNRYGLDAKLNYDAIGKRNQWPPNPLPNSSQITPEQKTPNTKVVQAPDTGVVQNIKTTAIPKKYVPGTTGSDTASSFAALPMYHPVYGVQPGQAAYFSNGKKPGEVGGHVGTVERRNPDGSITIISPNSGPRDPNTGMRGVVRKNLSRDQIANSGVTFRDQPIDQTGSGGVSSESRDMTASAAGSMADNPDLMNQMMAKAADPNQPESVRKYCARFVNTARKYGTAMASKLVGESPDNIATPESKIDTPSADNTTPTMPPVSDQAQYQSLQPMASNLYSPESDPELYGNILQDRVPYAPRDL